ncbi:MAG: DUF1351 domain-containing protein [Sedimentibacter sp.]|uniref:DUF1351 domain-containing protein n=1 Tax=Sedimentibacter sp. TaxID=1960295 RepID=UPI002982477D|nr:DUF1351 domain-containing protein [Sedimentibacter sp.]MDW5300725.1 DUF1351 domain-containing protein [Sedimentibacter sp.]
MIKVKVIDDNGQPKGRAYTYKSEIEVNIGDLVVADMAGKDKILIVTETNIAEEKVDFEIKTIKGLADDIETEEPATLEFKVEKEVLPVIKINFDEMKIALTNTLTEYNGIVVTEQSLSSCKSKQKDLASLRVKIDNYRKDKKKDLSKPITAFENQCKELIELVEKAEGPIKTGIKVFDDQKRDSKRTQAEELAKEVAAEYSLNEKYAVRLEILDKYCNLTAKSNEVREDLISKAMTLKVEQDREDELIDIIKDTIESENEKINRKMKFEDFKRYIDRGMTTKEVIAEIKLSASRIYEAENPPEPEPIIEVIPEPVQEPIFEQIPEPVQQTVSEPINPIIPVETEEPTYYAVYRVVGKLEQLRSVSKFLKDNEIEYTVTDQGEI